MDWPAIQLSLKLAASTTAVLLVLAAPLACWLAFSRWRWKFLIEAVVALPLVLPPTVLGFYLLLVMSPQSIPGGLYQALVGSGLAFSFVGILIASVISSLPFAVQPMAASFAAVDRRLLEASWCLGVSRLGTFFRVVAPLSLPGIIAGAVLSFAHTLGEFGVVLMVGGNIPGRTRTASIAVYDAVQAMDYDAAGRTAVFLLVFSFAALAATFALRKRAVAL